MGKLKKKYLLLVSGNAHSESYPAKEKVHQVNSVVKFS